MEYFKRNMSEKEVKDSKLVGADIPTNVSNYLNLFCVVDSCSKSSIIRPLIEKWAKKAKEQFPDKRLIDLAANKGFASWKNRKNKKITFPAMMKVQRRELERRGISESDIDKIIKKIEDAKSKEN